MKTRILLILIALCLTSAVRANDFTGVVKYARYTDFDTTYYNIIVGKIVMKIEVADNNHVVRETYIFNHITNKGITLSPERKQYMELGSPLFTNSSPSEDFTIIKTNNYRIINRFKCYQWRIRNEKLSTEVEYWVISYNYQFFCRLNYFNGKVGFLSSFFCYIPDNYEHIPVEAIEYNLFREKKARLCLLEIRQFQPDESIFEIPKNYVKVK